VSPEQVPKDKGGLGYRNKLRGGLIIITATRMVGGKKKENAREPSDFHRLLVKQAGGAGEKGRIGGYTRAKDGGKSLLAFGHYVNAPKGGEP